jgi:hypothetical protein
LGSSQAIALTWATSSGGKTARVARPRPVLQTLEALLAESSSPATDDVRGHAEALPDLHVGLPLCRVEHKLGALYLAIRT